MSARFGEAGASSLEVLKVEVRCNQVEYGNKSESRISKENINAGISGSSFFLVTGGSTRQELEPRAFLNVSPPGLALPDRVMR